jgi:hypothetical protein
VITIRLVHFLALIAALLKAIAPFIMASQADSSAVGIEDQKVIWLPDVVKACTYSRATRENADKACKCDFKLGKPNPKSNWDYQHPSRAGKSNIDRLVAHLVLVGAEAPDEEDQELPGLIGTSSESREEGVEGRISRRKPT